MRILQLFLRESNLFSSFQQALSAKIRYIAHVRKEDHYHFVIEERALS